MLSERVVQITEKVAVGPEIYDVASFETDDRLGEGMGLILQLKGFNRNERLQRRSEQVNTQTIMGSKSARQISPGAVMILDSIPKAGEIISEEKVNWDISIPDSRGMYLDKETGDLYFASVDTVYVMNMSEKVPKKLELDKRYGIGFIHSIDLSSDRSKILITSAGFDSILEFDLQTQELTRSWRAWEHGFASEDKAINIDSVLKKYPEGLGLPPAERAVFPNSAVYADGSNSEILVTSYHLGMLDIDLNTGESIVIDGDFLHPHSALSSKDSYTVTDTGHGVGYIFDKNLTNTGVVNFANLDGLDPNANGREWLQQFRPVDDDRNIFLAVDSNRSTIWIIDLDSKTRRKIPIKENWVLQEVMPITG